MSAPWVVYQPDWITVHSIRACDLGVDYPHAAAAVLATALMQYRAEHYNVDPDDAKYAFHGAGEHMVGHLFLRLYTCKGVFVDYDLALRHVTDNCMHDALIVERYSVQDREIRAVIQRVLT